VEDIKQGRIDPESPNAFRRTRRKLYEMHNSLISERPDGSTTMRKPLSTTGNAALDSQINAKLFQLVTGTTGNNGMTFAQYEEYVGTLQMQTLNTIRTAMQQVVLPRIYNMFWGFLEQGSDYDFGYAPQNVTGVSADCRATVSDPYRCCQNAITSPYSCCHGLLGCMPMPSDSLKPPVTTEENVQQLWQCTDFRSYLSYMWQFVRILWTAISYVVWLMTGLDVGWIIAYQHDQLPTNTGGCIVLFSKYLGITALVAVGFWVIISTFAVLGILAWLKNEYSTLRMAYTQLNAQSPRGSS
jgi:hypothetical protein